MQARRPRFSRGVLVAAAIILGFFVYAALMIARYGELVQEFGWQAVQRDGLWYVASVVQGGPAGGRMQPGDWILAVNGDERVARVGPFFKLRVEPPAESYSVRVTRGASHEEFHLQAPVRRDWQRLPVALSLMLASLSFYVVGIFVGLQRPGERMPRRLMLSSLATSLVLLYIALQPPSGFLRGFEALPLQALRLAGPFHVLLGFHFLYRFASGDQPQLFWTWVERLLWTWGLSASVPLHITGAVAMPGFPGAMELAFQHQGLFTTFPPGTAVGILGTFYISVYFSMVAVVAANYRRTTQADQRRRLKWIVYGTVAGLLPPALATAADTVLSGAGLTAVRASNSFRVMYSLASALTILIPISWGYAIAKHRVLGVHVVVRRGIQYLLARNSLRMLLLLVPVAGLGYTILSSPDRTIAEVLFGPGSYVYLVIIAASSLSLKYRARIINWVDRRFFREVYNQEKILLELIENVQLCASITELSRLVCREVDLALHPASIHVFYRERDSRAFALEHSSGTQPRGLLIPEDFQLLRLMEQRAGVLQLSVAGSSGLPDAEAEWLHELGVSLLVAMKGSDQRLAGLLLLGEKKSEEPYSADDRKLLQAIAGQVALAYENLWLKERVEQQLKVERDVLAHLEVRNVNLLKECPTCGDCFDRAAESCPRDGVRLILTLPVERTIDSRYRLDRLLGRGGMGAVYEASDLRLKRKVAVKIMLGALFGRADALRRFEREAHASAQLSHPSIIAVFDYGRLAAEGAYLVMELLRGSTWRAELNRLGNIEPALAAEWFDQLLSGLGAAHRAGVVHRDLKPENVMLERSAEGHTLVRILDFGLAKTRMLDLSTPETRTVSLTQPGMVLGTYTYMSPEQLTGREVDERTDFFSLGIMLVETLTGQRPFRGDTLAELHYSVLRESFHLTGQATEVRRLDAVLQRCLAKEPKGRFRSAADLQRELVPALRNCPRLTTAQPTGPSTHPRSPAP